MKFETNFRTQTTHRFMFNSLSMSFKKGRLDFTQDGLYLIVRKKGLEPPRREAPDPKSGAATNYATSAVRIY
jgi:hypothetical protein